MEEEKHHFQETASGLIPLFSNYDFHHLPAVIEEDEEFCDKSHFGSTTDNGLSFTPNVTFKMSLSSESMDKCIPPKSPLRSALKPGTHFFNQEVVGLKRVNKSEIDDLQKQLESEKWSSEKHCFPNLPDHAVTQLYFFDAEKNGGMWHEAARFVKYEESVEGIDTMWSTPHVPFLPFTAIMALRKLIESNNAMCALDIEGSNFGEICHFTANELEALGALDLDDSNSLVSFLTFRREHARNNIPNYKWIRKLTGTGREGVVALFQREPPSRSCSTGAIDLSRQQRLQKHYSRAYDSFSNQEPCLLGSISQTETSRKNSESAIVQKDNCNSVPSKVPEYQPLLTVLQDPVQKSYGSHESLSDSLNPDDDDHIPENSICIQILVGRTGIFKTTKFIFIRLNAPLVDRHLTRNKFPIKFFFLILGPRENNETFLEMGRVMASMCTNQQFLMSLYRLTSKNEILNAFDTILNETMIIPPIELDSPEVFKSSEYEKVYKRSRFRKKPKPKKSTTMPKIAEEKEESEANSVQITVQGKTFRKKRRFFRGFVQDSKNFFKRYSSDFKDVRRGKQMALTTIISLYLSLLPPTITFAKILETFTDHSMGIMEALMSTCLGGVLWGVLGGQPMLIQGVTGPILIFESSFYQLCHFAKLDYMEVRVYSAVVIALLSFATIAFDGTRLLKYVTKFTEEIFCGLISLIYIAETLHYMYHEYLENPSRDFYYYKNYTPDCSNDELCEIPRPSAGILAVFVIFFCTTVSMFLYFLRFSKLLGRSIRNVLADFNILITLSLTMLLIYLFVPFGILDTVQIPEFPTWTNSSIRSFDFFVIPRFEDLNRTLMHVISGFIGGSMVFLLLFAETAMVEILIENKDKKLEKPGGVNWDLMVMSICTIFSSIFGLPWICVSGVQTIEHAKGLSFMKKTAPGAKPEVDRVVENRVTTLAVALLFGATTFLGRFLKFVPLACLFGVFMYLGTSSMLETTLFKGLMNVLHFGKNFRHTEADLNVTANRIRFYRFLQLIGLVWIYAVKQFKVVSILFPFVFIAFIGCRQFILPWIYNEEELLALDPPESESTDSEDTTEDN